MKSINRMIIAMMVFLLIYPSLSFASEDSPNIPYYGIGANVQILNDDSFLVNTEGLKDGEGFVFTPDKDFKNNKIKLKIDLKGTGTVTLKISETDSKGRFIKDKTMDVELVEEWTTYVLPFELASTSSQVDVSIFTKNKMKTQFYFKNLEIVEE